MPSDLNHSRPPGDSGRSVPELLSSLVGQISTLFRQEVRLARAEIGEKFGHAAAAVVPIGAGAGLLLGALVVLLFALAAGISALFGLEEGWSLLIVGVLAALIGYLLIRGGISRLKVSNLMPERTADQLSRDAQVAKEQIR
jgi:hypothetical protein